jgi:hypothetical protein
MSGDQSAVGAFGRGILAAVLAVVGGIALLIIELISAMLVYLYLDLYRQDLFGALVRWASDVFNALAELITPLFAASANQAYASLIGELSPKAILLLMIGLVVGALIRLLVWLVKRIVAFAAR